MKKHRLHLGFTLVELLVVIAIICILFSILMPVFVQGREKARRAKCQSHEKELLAALMLYTDDYDGFMPYIKFLTWRIQDGVEIRLFEPYTKDFEITLCPTNQAYAYNECLCGPLAKSFYPNTEAKHIVGFVGRSLSSVRLTSQTPAFFDAFRYRQSPTGQRNSWGWEPADAFNRSRMLNLHMGGANYAFLDGHVEWLKPAGDGIYVVVEGIDYDGNGTVGSGRTLR
jgi:prepilin-type N-terminal cleavage/methylation domain-containing protein/prepilin-type processing-associated H-X9-DG protein